MGHPCTRANSRQCSGACREDVDAINAQQLRELPDDVRKFVAQVRLSPSRLLSARLLCAACEKYSQPFIGAAIGAPHHIKATCVRA